MRSGMKKAAVLFILCIFFCGICPCSALGLTEAEISSSEEWVWEAGSVNSFQGNVTADQDYQDAVLTLSVESGLENSGEALFMVVNGKKLKIRKRSSSITEDLSAGEALSFEGGWYLPETLAETVGQADGRGGFPFPRRGRRHRGHQHELSGLPVGFLHQGRVHLGLIAAVKLQIFLRHVGRLRNLLKQYRYTWPELSKELSRSEGAIQRRINDLKIKDRPIRADPHAGSWTPELVAVLKDGIRNGDPYSLIAQKVGKSEKAVRGYVFRIWKTEVADKIRQIIKEESNADV